MLCVWLTQKLSVVRSTQLKIQPFAYGDNLLELLKVLYSFSLSPCSGLVVSGYSKTQNVKTLTTNLAQATDPYKKFKMMYTVDNTSEFTGR